MRNGSNIPWVRVTDANGKVTEYRTEDFKDDFPSIPSARMDCMDCHNRPSHKFLTPNDAVDRRWPSAASIRPSRGRKPRWSRLWSQPYATREEAQQKIDELAARRISGRQAGGRPDHGGAGDL